MPKHFVKFCLELVTLLIIINYTAGCTKALMCKNVVKCSSIVLQLKIGLSATGAASGVSALSDLTRLFKKSLLTPLVHRLCKKCNSTSRVIVYTWIIPMHTYTQALTRTHSGRRENPCTIEREGGRGGGGAQARTILFFFSFCLYLPPPCFKVL